MSTSKRNIFTTRDIKVDVIFKTKQKIKNKAKEDENCKIYKENIISILKEITLNDEYDKDELLTEFMTNNNIYPTKGTSLNRNQNINAVIKDFSRKCKIIITNDNHFYLQKKGKIIKEIDKSQKVCETEIEDGDKLIITDDKEIKKKLDKQIVLDSQSIDILLLNDNKKPAFITDNFKKILKNFLKHGNQTKINGSEKNRNIRNILLVLFSFLIIVLISIGIYLYYKVKKFKFQDEELKVDINYTPNMVYRYNFSKKIKMRIEGESLTEENSTREFEQKSEFFFIIKEHFTEYNQKNYIKKNWFRGYIAVLNISFNNETSTIPLHYDKNLENIINNKNLRKNSDRKELNYSMENISLIKIDFYEKGVIKDYYYPKENFNLTCMEFIKELATLIIPKISSELYVESINKTLSNKLVQDGKKENKNGAFLNEEEELRFLEEKEKDRISHTNIEKCKSILNNAKKRKKYRILSNNDNYENSSILNYEIEEYITPPLLAPNNIDLREKNNCPNCTGNNLTEFSSELFGSDKATLENSMLNKTIYTKINENGILESVTDNEISILKNERILSEDLADSINKAKIFDENNLITLEDIQEEENKENMNFGLEGMNVTVTKHLNLIDNFSKNEILKGLYEYFDSLKFKVFDEEYYNEYIVSLIEDKIKNEYNLTNNFSIENVESDEIERIRRLDIEKNTYYGMKKMINVRDLYNYNLLGLKMQQQMYNELDPRTGLGESYFIMTFGNINRKIKSPPQQSNLHIIIEKKNQMTFNLIQLLYQSNLDLKQKNKNISEIILNLEDNLLEKFRLYDYSNIYRECLEEVNSKLDNLTGIIFDDLIKLIEVVYQNYTNILSNVQNRTYDIFDKIREVTQNEYINYINNMVENLELFTNETLFFLDKIEDEVNSITKFEKIDFLYDILDNIYECQLILLQFNRNLYRAIEKGILSFKTDIEEFKEFIIGDILYITDYLSININKNPLIIRAYDDKTRNELTIKLRAFRDIIQIILDFLISDINNDYMKEMSINNRESIKLDSEKKSKLFLEKINKRADEVTSKIKEKIDYIKLYENYAANLDFINYVNNKTLIEFISNINNNFLKKAVNIQPEYLNNESEIYKKKDELLNISKLIIEQINEESNDINKYINDYINKYKEENIYNMQYNLFKIHNLFLENETESLLNQLKKVFISSLELHKRNIDYNYNLGMAYVNELHKEIIGYHDGDANIGKGFLKKYQKFLNYYTQYIYDANSEEVYNNLELSFNEIKVEIFNFIKNKILSINEYYFAKDIYKDNFSFINRMNSELFSIIEKINQYFSEDRFNLFKTELMTFSLNELQNYNKPKNKSFVNAYEYIRKHCNGIHWTPSDWEYHFYVLCCIRRSRNYNWLKTTNNIEKVNMDISPSINYVKKNSKPIFENFKKRVDKYLSKYINYIQMLYKNLHSYVENKINNNTNIQTLLNNYKNIFDYLLKYNSNFGLVKKLLNNTDVDIHFIDILENNTNLIIHNYLNSYYFPYYDKFLEYPNEINYKINQFKNELRENLKSIKIKVNNIYRKRTLNIINATNIFLKNIIYSNREFILINIYNNKIMEEYLNSKNQYLSKNFELYLNNLMNLSENIYKPNSQNSLFNLSNDENFILNENNYEKQIFNISKTLEHFVSYLEEMITQNFTYENCYEYNNSETDIIKNFSDQIYKKDYSNGSAPLICNIIKYKSNLSNYEYNYNVVKIRTGLFYTKKSLENILYLFDDLNYEELLNIEKYNIIENKLNDNCILDIYKLSLYKLMEINNYSIPLLEEQNEYFYKDIINIYPLNNDYYPFLKKFEKLLKLEDQAYNDYYREFFNKSFELLLSEFNTTLYKQKNEYELYNIDKINSFQTEYENFQEQIKISFENFKAKIKALETNPYFLNSFNNHLRNIQSEKRALYKNIIISIERDFNYRLLNMTFNIGELFENFITKEYEEHVFKYLFEYIQVYDSNLHNFINKISEYISVIENNFKIKFKKIFNEFYHNLYKNATLYINEKYVQDLKHNFTSCLNYSMNLLNEIKKEDAINYKKYLEYLNYINNSSGNSTKIEEIIYYNKTEHLLNCNNNNYYNYTVKIYKNFEEKYLNQINNIIYKIERMNSIELSDNLLYKYMKENYELEPLNITKESFNDLYYNFFSYEDNIAYLNYTLNPIYFNFLNDSLIKYFQSSYENYINNYLIYPIVDNITIFVNDYSEIHINYLINKIKDEYYYYLIILNDTKELGVGSINSLNTLYDDAKKKINQSISYIINEYVFFYLDIFYRKNKNIFFKNYIKYYANKLNEYKIEIYQLQDNINELIYDDKFNKTLNKISNELMKNLIIKKLNSTLNEFLNNKLHQAYITLDNLQREMSHIVSKIPQNEDNNKINEIIINYQIILLNQNNQFTFKISNIPFDYLYSFLKNVLQPPLLEIKKMYNLIEEDILEKILIITENFPDIRQIIKEKLAIEDILDYIKFISEEIKEILLQYHSDLNDEYNSYINKLIHYTYISGLFAFDKPCNYSFCSINISNTKNQQRRNLDVSQNQKEKINIRNYTDLKNNKTFVKKNKNINLKRRLTTYDETMGSLSTEDIIPYLNEIRNTMYELNGTYIKYFDKNGKTKYKNYINKINITYKINLERTITTATSRFSPILSKDSFQILLNSVFRQYYKLVNYINNITGILENDINELFIKLNDSSKYFELMYDLSYDQIIGYHKILNELIQSRLNMNTNKQIKRNLKKISKDDIDPIDPNEINKETLKDIENAKKNHENVLFNYQKLIEEKYFSIDGILTKIFKKEKIDKEKDTLINVGLTLILEDFKKISMLGYQVPINLFSLEVPLPPLIFFFPSFPILQIRLVPSVGIGLNFKIGFQLDFNKKEYTFYYDLSIDAEISLSLEAGLYFSIGVGEISLAVGIKGILGSGSVGMKLSIFIDKPKYKFELYYEFKTAIFSFYVLFKVEINIAVVKFSFKFYLINKILNSNKGLKDLVAKGNCSKEFKLPKALDIIIKSLIHFIP